MRSHSGLGLDLSARPLVTGMFPLIRCLGVTGLTNIRLPGHLYHGDDYCSQRTQQRQRHRVGGGLQVQALKSSTGQAFPRTHSFSISKMKQLCTLLLPGEPAWDSKSGFLPGLVIQAPLVHKHGYWNHSHLEGRYSPETALYEHPRQGGLESFTIPKRNKGLSFDRGFCLCRGFCSCSVPPKKPHRSTSIIKWFVY